jgi:ABC-2 type transport system ATP-binding protein
MTDSSSTGPGPANAIEARGLRKQYRGEGGAPGALALKDVDLAIPRGAFFGLLGPNGAGKSTFINVLAGLVIKSAGQVSIWGNDIDTAPRQARASIGVVPQELNLDAFFTPRELLDWQAGLYGVPRAERRTEEILALVGLGDKADSYSRSLSGGMRRRLLVAKAMVHSPPILVLDEPTAGVDIELRHQLWDNIRALNEAGVTVLLTTHYLEEAEQLCDWIAIINHGEVVACDETSSLLGRLDQKELTVMVAEELDGVPPALSAYAPEVQPYGRLVFRYRPSQTQIAALLAAVRNADLTIVDLTTEESDLEDLFLELVSGGPGD